MIEMRFRDVGVRVAPLDDATKLVADQRIGCSKKGGRTPAADLDRPAEGNSLALRLAGEPTPRPLTSDLIANMLRVTDASVKRVAVTDLRDTIFYAVISVAVGRRVDEVDARPSDALNLAARVGAPIFAGVGVLEQCAMLPDDLATGLDAECAKIDNDLPPGEWRSLSAELLYTVYHWGRR